MLHIALTAAFVFFQRTALEKSTFIGES